MSTRFGKVVLFVFLFVSLAIAGPLHVSGGVLGQVPSPTPVQTPVQAPNQTPSQVFFTKTLYVGSRGEEVKKLQIFLSQFSDIYPQGIISGYFGLLTKSAVKKFQQKYGLEQVGIVGPKTRTILNGGFDRLLKDEAKAPVPTKIAAVEATVKITDAGKASPPPPEEPKPQKIISPLPTATGCTAIAENAFTACFYNDANFQDLETSRTDSNINFNWFDGAPVPQLNKDNFSVRWQGIFDFESGEYEFVTVADDYARLYIDNELVGDAANSAKKTLGKGKHRLTLDYVENSNQAKVQLFWDKTKTPYFEYAWKAASTLTGEIKLPTPVPKPVVVLDGKPTILLDSAAAIRLAQVYKIVLVDTEEKWDDAAATMLLEMVRRVPDTRRVDASSTTWKVALTNEPLTNDVAVRSQSKEVRISKPAFQRSNPQLQPSADGNNERVFYSNRLFRAVLQAFFNERGVLENVLFERYGFKAGIGDPPDEFQEFSLEELQYLDTVFEDMPAGFRNMPGLERIVRRKQGLTNPLIPGAAAIAWVDQGYMEFTDLAFRSGSADYIRRLVAHEITHFLWHKVFGDQTRKEWMELSGWSTDPSPDIIDPSTLNPPPADHPKAIDRRPNQRRWYRKTTTNFVSAYAAFKNPDEDFADTMAYYIYQPDWVRTIAPEKYNFIKNIVNGYEYVTLIDKQFTFEVFDLEPDVTFPGKIMGIDISVRKLPGGANKAKVLLHLSEKLGDGAAYAYTQLISPQGTYVNVNFNPVDGNQLLLGSEFIINKYMAHGYWAPNQITVLDRVDNRRYEGQNQFNWLMFINNPEEDNEAPSADINRVTYEVVRENNEKVVKVTVPVMDKNDREGIGGSASLSHYESGQSVWSSSQYNFISARITYSFVIKKYKASGDWTFREFRVEDVAGNAARYDMKGKVIAINVQTERPDYVKPELDVSSIKIRAVPRFPESPNGETDVTIWYRARDDNSGLGVVSFIIQKPTGDTLYKYHYHDNFYTDYFVGNPAEYKNYQIDFTLPVGSPPGTWALQEIVARDKAENTLTNNFVEIGILKPFEVK